MNLCNYWPNEKTPRLSRAFPESVVSLEGAPNQVVNQLSPLFPLPVKSTGNSLVRITGSGLLLGVTVGSPIAHRLRTNRILESGAAGKAVSVMRVPVSSERPTGKFHNLHYWGLVELCLNLTHSLWASIKSSFNYSVLRRANGTHR